MLKPARSKHCSLCGVCVPLFDHHCIWLNQCVGERNYREFLLFLAVNSAFFFYATYVCAAMAVSPVFEMKLFSARFKNPRTGKVAIVSV